MFLYNAINNNYYCHTASCNRSMMADILLLAVALSVGVREGGGGWGEEQGKVDVSPGLVKKYFLTLVYLLSIIMLFIILHPRPKLYGFTTVW